MAERAEAAAQIARMLSDPALRTADDDRIRAAVDADFERLADALVEETAASDDVSDRESGLRYAESRVRFLAIVLSSDQQWRLLEAVRERLEAW